MTDPSPIDTRAGIRLDIHPATGALRRIHDASRDMTVLTLAGPAELELNGLPLPTRLARLDDNASDPAQQALLESVSHPSVGSALGLRIFRSVLVGDVDKPFGGHLAEPASLHIRYQVERLRVERYEGEIATSAGVRPMQAPLWVDTIAAMAGRTDWFGPETRMLQAAAGGAGPNAHVGVDEGPIPEVVARLWNRFRTTHPGVQTLPGAAYHHPDGRWLWITAQRPDVGMRWDYQPDRCAAVFEYHDRLAFHESIYLPEVSLYWGRGGRDEMLRVMADRFSLYEEPPTWFYHTTWFWLHHWGRREGGFAEMGDQAKYLHDELGITGFGVAAHDVRPGCFDCAAASLRPSPLRGGDEGMRRLGRSIEGFGGHAFVWLSWMGLHGLGDVRPEWKILGDDGRPYESFSMGLFDLYHALNFNHPEVRKYYLDIIRQYVTEFGVEGIFWDCGGVPLPPDHAPKPTRPFQRFPSEAMVSAYRFMEEVMRLGRSLSEDFFMWHETFSADLPGHGYSSHTGQEAFLAELAHAGRKRLVYRSGSTYNLDGGFAMIRPKQDTVFRSPVTRESLKPIAEDPMNRWLVRFVAEHGVRDARRIDDGAAWCGGHVIVDPVREQGDAGHREVTAPIAFGDVRRLENVITGKVHDAIETTDAGSRFRLDGGAAYAPA